MQLFAFNILVNMEIPLEHSNWFFWPLQPPQNRV